MRRRPRFSPLRHAFGLAALAALAGGCLLGGDRSRAPDPTPAGPAPALAPPPLASGRLPDTATPLRYAVSLVVDPARERFTGDVTITVQIPRPTQALVLHGRDLTVSHAELTVGDKHVTADASFRMAVGGRDAADELVLTLGEVIPAGIAEVRVAYSAPIGDRLSGLFRVAEEGAHYAFTQLEPTDARRVIPCFDEPGFKVPFDLKVTTPKGNLVVANAPELEHRDADDGRSLVYQFARTAPLPTYLFAFAVGPFDVREARPAPGARSVPIRLIAPRGKAGLGELALSAAAAQVELLGGYFDRPYPYAKLDLVAVPEFGFGAMENAGLISFREELVLLDGRSAGAASRHAMAKTLAHELAHHWFGDLVTIPWWDDLWLNEGFATWIEGRVLDTWRPGSGARLDALRAKGEVMELDALDSARPVRQRVTGTAEAEEVFDEITYDKGAALFGMIEAWLGPEVFQRGIREHLKAHEHGVATAADLLAALGRAAGRDVAPVAATFLDQAGVPLVRAEPLCKAGEAPRVALTAERFRPRERRDVHDQAWKIPICIAYEGAGSAGPACGLVDGRATEIALPLPEGRCPKWIYPNADERGYFRFALPPAGQRALSRAGRALGPTERLGLVANTWALVQSGDVEADALMDLLEAMRGERDRRVVEQIVSALEHLGRALVDAPSRGAFRAFVTRSLLPIAKELGWDPRKGEADDRRLLRVRVLSALAELTDETWVATEAEKRAAAWLADPGAVDADVAAVALRAASRRAGAKRFDALVEAARKARSPEDRLAAVSALGAFGDPALVRRALDLMLSAPLKIQDGFHVFNAALARPESRPGVLAWVKERFGELKAKVPDFALSRLAGAVETICDAPTLEDASTFFGEALKGTEGGEHALVHALQKAEMCIDLRGRQAEKVGKRLGR
jgi:aminopeptidase N